jgi:hypothetical protein
VSVSVGFAPLFLSAGPDRLQDDSRLRLGAHSRYAAVASIAQMLMLEGDSADGYCIDVFKHDTRSTMLI